MSLLRGAAAGTLATGAMSAVMLGLGQKMGEQPPDAIVQRAALAAGKRPSEPTADLLATLAHVAFGAGVGAAYALLPRRLPPVARGVATALAVYVVSYEGWVPALGILPPATQDRPQRQRVMLLAHVVYGAVLGIAEEELHERRR